MASKGEWFQPSNKSGVWEYFKKNIKDNKKVQCTICGKTMNHDKATSTLRRHITNVHDRRILSFYAITSL